MDLFLFLQLEKQFIPDNERLLDEFLGSLFFYPLHLSTCAAVPELMQELPTCTVSYKNSFS
jgi:hypothetical protein